MASISDVGGAVMTIQEVKAQIIDGFEYFKQYGYVHLMGNEISIHAVNKDKFIELDAVPFVRARESHNYPYEIVKVVDGIEFFCLVPKGIIVKEKCDCCTNGNEQQILDWLAKEGV